jgi:hypothetical protein
LDFSAARHKRRQVTLKVGPSGKVFSIMD